MNNSVIIAEVVDDPIALSPIALSRRPSLGALFSLFILTLRQLIRGRRLLVMSLLFALPSILAVVVNLASRIPPRDVDLQFALIFNLIPHALAPLAALLYATGIIQDDVEEQTLTYLLLRPLPRWALYLIKLLATLTITCLVTAVFTAAAFAAIFFTGKGQTSVDAVDMALKTAGILALAQIGYCGIFGLLGLIMRRSLMVGVAYIFLFEGVLASIDMVVRRLTVMYYYRVLVLRWINPINGREWSIDLSTAPEAQACMLTLLGIGIILSLVAAILFAVKEFRMKTPESNG